MKKSLKKLLRSLWLVCFGAMPLCIVGEALAGDDIAEIEAALAREAQVKPRLMAASARLLAATGDDNTYWATGELNVTKRRGETISLQFDIPKSYAHITSATLTMNAYDVDSSSTERDEVYFNGTHHIGTLVGGNNIWHENSFSVPASAIHTGINTLRIDVDVDQLGWITRIEWAKLVIDGEVDYIKLEASQNYDDRIQLKWNVSTGLAEAKFYVYRSQDGKPGTFNVIGERLFAKPNQYMYFSDKSCTPGVNYYYYITSLSGIQSETKIGKRTVKVVDPNLEFTLEGSDHPLDRGALGLSEETDILVAGHSFHFKMSIKDCSSDFTIKKIELIGVPAGGAYAQREHKIICSLDAYDKNKMLDKKSKIDVNR